MNILKVIGSFYPPFSSGGAAIVAHDISNALVKKGHEVTVYTTNALSRDSLFHSEQNPIFVDGAKVYYFNNLIYKPSVYICFSEELVKAVKENIVDYDLIHLHEYRSYISLAVGYYAKKHHIPYVLQAHGQLSSTVKWGLRQIFDAFFGYRLLRDASKVIALSRMEADQYRDMGVPEEKIATIPNGINLSDYAELPPKGSFKKKFNISEDRKIILYLGRIHKLKGIEFLIKAYAYLKNKMNFKDAILVIAGPNDGYLKETKRLASFLKVANETVFTGMLSKREKICAYVDSNVVVNVEPRNVFGLVPLEVAACGTPAIVSKTNAISEVVTGGKLGFSVEYGDVISLASMLYRVLSDRELSENLGRNARRYIFDNFDWNKIIGEYEEVYKEVANRKR
jgi:glycosyltransferase involved in cell wall biosynthesis